MSLWVAREKSIKILLQISGESRLYFSGLSNPFFKDLSICSWRRLDISSFFSRIAHFSMRKYVILEKTRFSALSLLTRRLMALRVFSFYLLISNLVAVILRFLEGGSETKLGT
jgi:hypothetical protein